MRKLVLMVALAAIVGCSSCGSTETSNGNNENQALANTEVTQNESEAVSDEIIDEEDSSSNVDKEMFQQLSDEAVAAFDFMSNEVKLAYPDVKGALSYGFAGNVSINDSDCYKFVVFNDSDDSYTETATVAVDADATQLYIYDAQSDEYSKFSNDDSSNSEELRWCETTTEPFVEYLSAETTEEIVVENSSEVISDSSVTE